MYRRKLENGTTKKDARVESLERELAALRERAKKAETATKSLESSEAKAKKDLLEYRKKKHNEKKKLSEEAQKVTDIYNSFVISVGAETSVPEDLDLAKFLPWLHKELLALEGYTAMGRDYASIAFLQAFAKALEDVDYEHFIGILAGE